MNDKYILNFIIYNLIYTSCIQKLYILNIEEKKFQDNIGKL